MLLAGLAGCEKVSEEPIQNLNGGRIHIIGHAGTGFESALNPFPSNTLSSIRKTLEGFNADGVELDVHLSADSVPILYHDQTLESMTECVGYPLENSAATLTACRYRSDFNSHITQNERILRLEEIFQRYDGSPLQPIFDLDLKSADHLPPAEQPAWRRRFARRLTALTEKYRLGSRVTFGTGDIDLLMAIRHELPSAALYLDENNFAGALEIAQRHQLTGLVGSAERYTKAQVEQAHAAGLRVVLFQILRQAEIVDAINKNPDAVQTDNILLTQQVVAARRR